MTVEGMLSNISAALSSANEGKYGGVIYISVNRKHQVLEEIGFTGLLSLMRQMRRVLVENAGIDVDIVRFGLSALVLRVPPAADFGQLQRVAQDLFDSLNKQSFTVESRRLAITVSMCLGRFDQRFADADEMLLALMNRAGELADEGGSALSFVEPAVSSNEVQSSNERMLARLMQALGHDTLKVVFQPLVAIADDDTDRAFAMFPRLKANDGQLITAAEFIPIAREGELLPSLDRWMLNHAVRLVTGPFRSQSIYLFINQSGSLLCDANRQAGFRELLAQSSKLDYRVVLELSMDDVMLNLDSAVEVIRIARQGEFGICLSRIDEHSRWDLIDGELKCQYLRISPDFVARLVQHRDLEERFLELSAPARKAGTRIIMPMIENSQTAASMWRAGADYMQGNMLQEPVDRIELED